MPDRRESGRPQVSNLRTAHPNSTDKLPHEARRCQSNYFLQSDRHPMIVAFRQFCEKTRPQYTDIRLQHIFDSILARLVARLWGDWPITVSAVRAYIRKRHSEAAHQRLIMMEVRTLESVLGGAG